MIFRDDIREISLHDSTITIQTLCNAMGILTVLLCSTETILSIREHPLQLMDLVLVLILHLHADLVDASGTTFGDGTSAFQLLNAHDSTFIFFSCYHEFGLVFRYFIHGLKQPSVQCTNLYVHILMIFFEVVSELNFNVIDELIP